jgi:hypothetical protein
MGVTMEQFMTMIPRRAIDAGLGNDRARIGSGLVEVSASYFFIARSASSFKNA